jgi:hypothetical protein
MEALTSFWQTFLGVAMRPRSTLTHLEKVKGAILQGALALLLVTAAYTLILLIFILRGYPAAAPSVLPLALTDQYKFQVWYQGPLFFVATWVIAAFLVLISRLKGHADSASSCSSSSSTSSPFVGGSTAPRSWSVLSGSDDGSGPLQTMRGIMPGYNCKTC